MQAHEPSITHTGIGARIPKRELQRLLSGRGRYVDDIKLPRMLHLCFVRSPHPHARILSIDVAAAKRSHGVEAVFTGADLNPMCEPFVGIALHRPGHRSPPQPLLAQDRAVWQGQPVVAIAAETRAQAEDAAELVVIEWQELPAVTGAEEAADRGSPAIHPELGDNVAFDFTIDHGDATGAFAKADLIIEEEFRFERQMAMTLEPRGLIADFSPAEGSLSVVHSHQSPFQMQDVFSRHLGIPEQNVRVLAPDVGGGFGMKVNLYAEEVAVAAVSMRLGRPVKYIVDRLESFLSDAHSRDHVIKARMALKASGEILAMEVDDIGAVGAYGMPIRFNVAEGMMAICLTGAPYSFEDYKARTRSVYVNKNLIGVYRGVGMPLACIVQELLTDFAADQLGIDTVEFKRRNYRPKSSLPCVTPGGQRLESVSFHECLESLIKLMDYERLRKEQEELRARGVYRGIGFGTFAEHTAYGPLYYGPSGAPVSTQDGCTLRLEPSGGIRCITSLTEQGQGAHTVIAQIVADTLGVGIDQVGMVAGDSTVSTYGGGAWGSRGTAIGGEAALKAGLMLKQNILAVAGAMTQNRADALDIVEGKVVSRQTGMALVTLGEVGKAGYFRQDTLPPGCDVQFSVTCSHAPSNTQLLYMANGIQGSYVEVDCETGFIKVLQQWAVDDCGRVINPLLVDEQVRGGIVQGIGAVLYEECIYSADGNLLNGTLADYLVPMADEMPDIHVAHVETPEASTQLGAKGVGEAGLIGAMGAVWVAVNDALKPLGAKILHQPFTPERMLDALGRAQPPARKSPLSNKAHQANG
ncbi:MAG TPA: xanthine dehydrogenase family protein molybdopterin-binding subunit [Xanthobacteraceae bacterium]|jgi:carbon-monoxide dehydrogenase large subunit